MSTHSLEDATIPICMQSFKNGKLHFALEVSGITDVGVQGKQNQDAFFCYCDKTRQVVVVGVFDGHGKELGKKAAYAAKDYFETQFKNYHDENYHELETNPTRVMQQMYAACHEMIKVLFRDIYERRGNVVMEDPIGKFLLVEDNNNRNGERTTIRGGTTATVVVFLHGGRKIISSNVGDSTAIIGTRQPMLMKNDLKCYKDLASKQIKAQKRSATVSPFKSKQKENEKKSRLLLLTGEHGADNVDEFLRARMSRRSFSDPSMPSLRFLYDCASARHRRLPVFHINGRGSTVRNLPGEYYKNMRDEWATVVAAPANAQFTDALAFTRSLGDFHMHSYGVSCVPTVSEVSLADIHTRETPQMKDNNQQIDMIMSSCYEEKIAPLEFMILICTDGVWDNWIYQDLFDFLYQKSQPSVSDNWSSSIDPSINSPLRYIRVLPVNELVKKLMESNINRAKSVFGEQADNMTAVLCHFRIQ